MRVLAGLWLLVTIPACDGGAGDPDAGPPPPDAYADLSGPVFAPDHVVQVSIEMAAADWDELRLQTRTFGSVLEGDCLGGPRPTPFATYLASVTIDGHRFDNVGVKKKGFFGSLNTAKPSLKVKLDEFIGSQEYLGLEKLTLNNANQDDSYLQTCLAYQTFDRTGIVAPRCNFAHVTVNGADLGIYVNVESIDKRLIKKNYPDGSGNLYEGSLSDFRTEWVNTFEPKGGGDRTDIQPLVTTLETATDAALVNALAADLDVDRFYTYWATEMLVNHWDGYSNNKNNFFIYNNPTTGQFEFIPWGVDATFEPGRTFGNLGSTTGPIAVAAAGLLANRLFAIPAERTRFLDRQRQLLTTVWNEAQLGAEVDRMETLITPIVDGLQGTAWHGAVDQIRSFVTDRRAALTAAIDAGPTWTQPLSGYPCVDVAAVVTGTFATTYGTIGAVNPLATGSGTFTLTITGSPPLALTPVGATSGLDPNPPPGQPASALLQVFGRHAADGHIIVATFAMQPARFFPRLADVGFFDSFGLVHDFNPALGTATQVGFMLGTLELDQAAPVNTAPVSGSFQANADIQGSPRLAPTVTGAGVREVAARIRGAVARAARTTHAW